jgi:hypothetical protein
MKSIYELENDINIKEEKISTFEELIYGVINSNKERLISLLEASITEAMAENKGKNVDIHLVIPTVAMKELVFSVLKNEDSNESNLTYNFLRSNKDKFILENAIVNCIRIDIENAGYKLNGNTIVLKEQTLKSQYDEIMYIASVISVYFIFTKLLILKGVTSHFVSLGNWGRKIILVVSLVIIIGATLNIFSFIKNKDFKIKDSMPSLCTFIITSVTNLFLYIYK